MSLRRSVGLAVLAMALTCRAAAAAAPELRARVTLSPTRASIGQLVTYRGSVVHPRGARVRWQAPENRESLTWGAPRSGVISSSAVRPGAAAGGVSTLDTAWIEVTLQAFELGEVRLAGLEFDYASGDAKEVRHERLPLLTLVVLPTVPADSTERLADVHAPIAAPWWERVPWGWIVGIVVVAVLAVLIWKRLARRRRVVAAPRTSVAAPTRDPRAEALDAIEALRSERLPEASRFGEHALRLGRILRVYLERSLGITQPGDTTPELVAHLRAGGAEPEELQRLAALLRIWDRVKFAREAPTVEEAQRAEQAVEAVVRRDRPIAAGRVA